MPDQPYARLAVRGCELGFAAAAISGNCKSMGFQGGTLIEPDRRSDRIRLSEKTHDFVHGGLVARLGKQAKPKTRREILPESAGLPAAHWVSYTATSSRLRLTGP